MADQKLNCYQLPATPLPLLLPVECIAAVVAKPKVEELKEARANWMKGYVTWENQRVPVLSYSALHDADLDESKKRKAHLVVLNPIPDAARKAYAGVICFGDIKQIEVDGSASYEELPDAVDRRYIDAVVKVEDKKYIVPKLAALGVAFSYF